MAEVRAGEDLDGYETWDILATVEDDKIRPGEDLDGYETWDILATVEGGAFRNQMAAAAASIIAVTTPKTSTSSTSSASTSSSTSSTYPTISSTSSSSATQPETKTLIIPHTRWFTMLKLGVAGSWGFPLIGTLLISLGGSNGFATFFPPFQYLAAGCSFIVIISIYFDKRHVAEYTDPPDYWLLYFVGGVLGLAAITGLLYIIGRPK
jgi:hypothetical protein